MAPEVTCVHPVREQLPWYLNGSLEGPEAAAVSAHLDTCEACSAELMELSSFAAGIDRHGVPQPITGATAASSPVRRFRVAASLAAGLLLPAIVGIYWAVLGFPRGERDTLPAPVDPPRVETPTTVPPNSPTLAVAVTLDLGGGAKRGGTDLPTLAAPDRSKVIVLTFRGPVPILGRPRLELRDAAGTALAHLDAEPGTDRTGRSTCVVPALLVQRPGDYSLVYIDAGPTRSEEFLYPFRIVAP